MTKSWFGRGAWVAFACSCLIWNLARGAAAQPGWVEAEPDVARVFELLSQRLALMPEVAAAKWKAQQPISDPAREQALLDASSTDARAAGLEAEPVRALLALQMQLARTLQAQQFERWSRGEAAPAARDLKSALRPELDKLGSALLAALALALPELTRAGASDGLLPRAQALLAQHALPADQARALVVALAGLRGLPEARLARIRAAGVLRVGTTGDYAPFSSDRSGALAGVDIELIEAFAKSLGVRARFVHTSWPSLLADQARDAFDLAASGISITPERQQVARFSVPYHAGGKTPLARCKERQRFDTLAEIDAPGVRVIVNPGGTNEQYVRAALHSASLSVFPDNRAIFAELVAGRADVMITDDVEAALQARANPTLCRTTRELFTRADKAWLLQNDAELQRQVDAWLGPRVESGAVGRALQRHLRAQRPAPPR